MGGTGANPPGPKAEPSDVITRRMVRSFLDLFVLELLSVRPRHGYELMKELERRLGMRVGPGTLYPLLNDLEGSLLVAGGWVTAGKARKVYRLTSTGEAFMRESFRSVNDLLARTSGTLAWVKLPYTSANFPGAASTQCP